MYGSKEGNVDYSVVIPVFYNEGLLKATFAKIKNEVLLANPQLRGEVIFVDDGSGDGSLAELLELRREEMETVRVIKLTRNFGQVSALRAGIAHARGSCAVLLSADGQDPPGLIGDMLEAHFSEKRE